MLIRLIHLVRYVHPLALCLILFLYRPTSGRHVYQELQSPDQEILELLMKHYDQRIRPPASPSTGSERTPHKGPVRVKVNVMMRMLSRIDVVNMEYDMQITFREQWVDTRLSFKHLNISNPPQFLTVPHVRANLWMPDSFFPSEKSARRHLVDAENMFIRIYADGTVLYSARLSLVCSCPMHLQLYPLDVQQCDFDLVSYAHTTSDIVYEWDLSTGTEPVQVKKGVGKDLPNFKLDDYIDTGVECSSTTNTGTYACLRMRLRFIRLMTYFVLQLYFPTTMAFWIDFHSTAGRVALAVTTLLTITTMQFSINSKLPPVSYIKVVDVWLGACQTFVFGALIEYAFVCYLDNGYRDEKRKQRTTARFAERNKGQADHLDPINYLRESRALEAPPVEQQLMGQKLCTCDNIYRESRNVDLSLFTRGSERVKDELNLEDLRLPGSCCPNFIQQSRKDGRTRTRLRIKIRFNLSIPSSHGAWNFIRRKLKKPHYWPARIDFYARIYMPVGFLLFNCLYWGVCLYLAAAKLKASKVQSLETTSTVQRPKPALRIWMEENRTWLQEAYLKAEQAERTGQGAFMRFVGARWQEVEDKSQWEELAAEDKLRYTRQKEDAARMQTPQ